MNDESHGALRGERLTVLRDLRGLTQGDLAEELGVTQSFISHVEKGQRLLPDHVAAQASAKFHLPMSFFAVGQGVTDLGVHTFRKKARASSRDERRVKRLFDEAARIFYSMSDQSGFRPVDLPNPADFDYDPEECAEAVRQADGLSPESPVRNVTRLIERRGVGVIAALDDTDADVTSEDHFGLSKPAVENNRPLIAIVRQLPGAVQRLTLGHELAHLIFDKHLSGPITSPKSVEEQRAFRFAGALLIPERVARKRITSTLSLHGYLRIKADYGISVGALVRRARDLGIINQDRYRSLNIQLSSHGWRRNEPVDVAAEEPTLLEQTFNRVVGMNRFAAGVDDFGIDPSVLKMWLPTATVPDVQPLAKVLSLRQPAE